MQCDICKKSNLTEYVDGKIPMAGIWANLCMECFKKYKVKLGTGKGQHYKQDEKIQFKKVAG